MKYVHAVIGKEPPGAAPLVISRKALIDIASLPDDSLVVRTTGDFTNKGYYLNTDYNWTIVKDNEGALVLLPLVKEEEML